MVEIICSESGVKFEAETRRTKIHPEISQRKRAADKDGSYRELFKAFSFARKANESYETAEDFLAVVDQYLADQRAERDAKAQVARERAARAEAAEKAREQKAREEDELIKANGYTWETMPAEQQFYGDEDEDGNYADYRMITVLVAPDGSIVERKDALAQIAEGNVPTAGKTQEETKPEKTPEQIAYDEARAEITAECVRIKGVDSRNPNYHLYSKRIARKMEHGTEYVLGKFSPWGDVVIYIESTLGEYAGAPTFWCSDPERVEKLGYTLYIPDNRPSFF